MIFLLIAGTATPAFLLAAPGGYGLAGLAGCGRSPWPPPSRTWSGSRHPNGWSGPPSSVLAGRPGWPCRRCGSTPASPPRCGAGRRPALHRRRGVLPPPPPRSRPGRVRLPRGVAYLRLRRRRLPVHRHRLLHRLTRATAETATARRSPRHSRRGFAWLPATRRLSASFAIHPVRFGRGSDPGSPALGHDAHSTGEGLANVLGRLPPDGAGQGQRLTVLTFVAGAVEAAWRGRDRERRHGRARGVNAAPGRRSGADDGVSAYGWFTPSIWAGDGHARPD